MYTVRRVAMHELSDFVAVLTPPERHASILAYVEHMFSQGAMRPEWCFLVEKEGETLGRAAFWALPGKDVPSDIVLLDLPWEDDACGDQLWQDLLLMCKQLGAEQLGYVLDTPAMAPQWQESGPSRQTFLEKKGFHLQRETSRFEWKSDEPRNQEANGGIQFRSLSEVGEAAFIDAIMRGSASTLDRQIAQERADFGPYLQAKEIFHDLQSMSYEAHWWELAYTPENELIGFVMPTKSPTFATIGYIGVLPEFRGRGYVDVLLNRGVISLVQSGERFIRADTDLHNEPMANSFLRAGFHRFAQRSEYRVRF